LIAKFFARSKFIKASLVSPALRQWGELQEFLLHNGKRVCANMPDMFFEELGMHKPDHSDPSWLGPWGYDGPHAQAC
jgi:hypothetical protein